MTTQLMLGSLNDRYYYVAQGKSSLLIVVDPLTFYIIVWIGEPRLLVYEQSRTEYQMLGRIHIHHKGTSKKLRLLRVMRLVWFPVYHQMIVMLPHLKGDEVRSSLHHGITRSVL